MSHIANTLRVGALPQSSKRFAPGRGKVESTLARLIPGGAEAHLCSHQEVFEVGAENAVKLSVVDPIGAKAAAVDWLPRFIRNLSPTNLLAALGDLWWMIGFFLAEAELTNESPNWMLLGFYVVIFLICADQTRLYGTTPQRIGPQIMLAKALLWTTFFCAMALSCAGARPELEILLLWSLANWLVLSARRELWRSFRSSRGPHRRNVMIVGNSSLGQAVADAISSDSNSGQIVREFLFDRCLRESHGATIMSRIARQACIDDVIVATQDPVVARIAVREARRNQLDVLVVPEFAGLQAFAMRSVPVPMLKVLEHKFPEWRLAAKRVADLVLSFAGLVVLSPLLLLIAVAIKLDSRGPVLYRALRVGRKTSKFTCYKFRTMIERAEFMKDQLRPRNQRAGAFFKISNDPRITRVGRFLRKYSLDELPQLWNVLKGEMSLVGPRPHPIDDVARYDTDDLRRLDFVPGITGLWQVTARQDPSFKRCVELDVEYIQNWSVLLDFKIMFQTVAAVLQGSGA